MTALRKDDVLSASVDKTSEELFQIFKTNAEAIGAKVYKCPDAPAAKNQILQIAEALMAADVIVAPTPLEEKLKLNSLANDGLNLYYENLLENGKTAQIGITQADYAIAETGSLCVNSLDLNVRLVSSLPLVHIALIQEDKIIENFLDSLSLLSNSGINGGPGYFSFITGPSRTSDIERVLTIGVHGPKELHIIFVPANN